MYKIICPDLLTNCYLAKIVKALCMNFGIETPIETQIYPFKRCKKG